MRSPDAATGLMRSLKRSAAEASVTLMFHSHDERPWESGLYSGVQHRVTASAPASPALDSWLVAVEEAEQEVTGHFVADVVIAGRAATDAGVTFRIEALTVRA